MSRHRSSGRAIALALTAIVLTGLLPAQVSAASRPAPAFALEPLGGKTVTLSDFKGSPVILLFWAPW
jgi:cytochrome c biogenesis protein CcmG, thiol:disulfide interchange protein DsbE